MKSLRPALVVLTATATLAAVVAVSQLSFTAVAADKPAAEQQASSSDSGLERTRREVRLLDDIYKMAIVQITEQFVTEKSDVPAGTAFKRLFATMKKNGWHDVRLLDATGEALDDENLPRDDFEKAAIKALVAGKPSPEEIVEIDGKRHLRVATPIPVVMQKCVMCHDNYAGNKGVIGALGYTLPIID